MCCLNMLFLALLLTTSTLRRHPQGQGQKHDSIGQERSREGYTLKQQEQMEVEKPRHYSQRFPESSKQRGERVEDITTPKGLMHSNDYNRTTIECNGVQLVMACS